MHSYITNHQQTSIMKKLILSLVAALCIGGFSTTQAQVKFGVVGGLNVSKLSYERSKLFDSENRAGWFIGPKMWVKVPLVGLGVNAAVEYNQRRLYGEVKESDGNISKAEYYKSIEIPINLRYSIGLASLASLYAETGPQFGFTVGDKTPSDMIKFKSSNVTWNVGLGVRLVNHLEIGATYNIALSNIGDIHIPVISDVIKMPRATSSPTRGKCQPHTCSKNSGHGDILRFAAVSRVRLQTLKQLMPLLRAGESLAL